MKDYLNEKTTRMLLIFGVFGIYFGYTHDSSNFIPAELKYGSGILALVLGLTGLYQNSGSSKPTEKEE